MNWWNVCISERRKERDFYSLNTNVEKDADTKMHSNCSTAINCTVILVG